MTGVSTSLGLEWRSGRRRQLAATDGVVGEPEAAQHRRVIKIASVEYDRRFEQLAQAVEIRAAEFLPLGDDGERIGTACGVVGILRQRESRHAVIDALCLPT